MEKNSDNLLNLSNLPPEIQQYIASYLGASTLGFFAQSHKRAFKSVLPLIIKYQTLFPLQLTAKGQSTSIYQANQLLVCGNNQYGQLGLGDNKHRFTFAAVPWPIERGRIRQVIPGWDYTLILTQDNGLWGCGYNPYGQLGLGDEEDRSSFTPVPWSEEQGHIQQVIAGGGHTVVLTQANQLWMCGRNGYGQLGLGDEEHRSTFTAVPWPKEQGRIQRVSAGRNHTVVLTHDNRLWVCGDNFEGQLGLGDKEGRSSFTPVPWPEDRGKIEQVVTGGNYTVVLTGNNRLWGCGANGDGQLGLGDNEHRLTFTAVPWPIERDRIHQVIAGGNHTVVLTEDNRLWVCGYNFVGQLGLGDQAQRLIFTTVPWPEDGGWIQQVIAGQYHTLVLTQDNRLWRCGYNKYGQLGLVDNEHRSTFTSVKALPGAVQQVFMLNNHLNQLIKLGTALALIPGKKSEATHSQCQLDEADDKRLEKK